MKVRSLNDEAGIQFITGWWGNGIAFGFKGDLDGINRCYNWASNMGVTHGRLHWLYDRESIGYILTTNEALLKGLTMQFRGEIIMGKEIAPIKDYIDEVTDEVVLEYNETMIDALARERAEIFVHEKIINDNFMSNSVNSLGPIYSMGNFDRSYQSLY